MKLKQLLASDGIAAIDMGFGPETVSHWNQDLDQPFRLAAEQSRSYVDAMGLLESGVLQTLFNVRMRQAITAMFDNPVIYHCHAYEIAGGQNVSHIHAGALCGWHGDDECVPFYRLDKAEFVSVFVYLTNVESGNDGAFELRPITPDVPLAHGQPAVEVLGDAGTTFAFNRAFAHRAQPNSNDKRRRVLKLSFQERHLPHARRDVVELARVSQKLGSNDEFLSQLFDTSPHAHTTWVFPSAGFHDSCVEHFTANSKIDLGIAGRLKTVVGGGRIAA